MTKEARATKLTLARNGSKCVPEGFNLISPNLSFHFANSQCAIDLRKLNNSNVKPYFGSLVYDTCLALTSLWTKTNCTFIIMISMIK